MVHSLFQRVVQKRFAVTLAVALLLQCGTVPQGFTQHVAPVTGQTMQAVLVQEGARQIVDEVESGLVAYDETPLGDRMPLVLVHGIGGTESRLFHWENFLAYAEKQAGFQQKYKIYLYHYDSTRSVPAISDDLQLMLKGFIGALGGRSIKILAYSEGGLLVRNALQDSYLNAHTEEVLAIATPFHGSPLANPEWMEAQAKSESAFNLVRLFQKTAYKITRKKYPTFREDFRWDNFDGAIPAEQYARNNSPILPVDYALARKVNFTTYGSYFGTDVDPDFMVKALGLPKPPPEEKLQLGNLFKKNFLFSLVRNNIGKLPVGKPAPQPMLAVTGHVLREDGAAEVVTFTAVAEPVGQAAVLAPEPVAKQEKALKPVSMMMYNDGISPISSTLWLGRYTTPEPATGAGVQITVDKLWSTLKSLRGNKNTRLFPGLDHRNWMDGVTRTGHAAVPDLLNPDETPRTVFDWIIYDLMT